MNLLIIIFSSLIVMTAASNTTTPTPTPTQEVFGNYSEPFKHISMNKTRSGRSVCKISEFVCRGGKCVALDKFCNGLDDCGDGSDEPRFCTACNRTYYGEYGRTYSISLSSATIAAALGLSHEQQLMQGDRPLPPTPFPQQEPLTTKAQSAKIRYQTAGNKEPRTSLKTKLNSLFTKGTSSSSSPVPIPPPLPPPTKRPPPPPQFVCQLTFAAAGDIFGDLIQVMFDSVNIGHFGSPTNHGCPHGSLQVAEINRPLTGGKWCGTGQGYAVYFSETSAISFTLMVAYSPDGVSSRFGLHLNSSSSVKKLTGGGEENKGRGGGAGGVTAADDFELKIRYKFIPRSLATVRFGSHGNALERGEVVPGSYCSRDFESCHRHRCKLQSPNYPGLYPRNVTCHYTIRHRERQPCKHVLLQVGQLRPHKLQLKSSGSGLSRVSSQVLPEEALLAWGECAAGNRDTLTIHDGTSPNDPVLLVLCGGNHVPPITSSSSELLVVFKATPFGNPLEPKASPPFPEPLRGFELDVDVIMVDSESAEYTNHKENCTFFFVSEPSDKCLLYKPQEKGGNWVSGRRGKVRNPRHTIQPNRKCRYEFKGTKHEVIWVYFLSYSRAPSKDANARMSEGNCTSKLTIRDGIDVKNEVLIGSYCDPELPKLCDHKALQNESRIVRSCTDLESYISAGPRLIIEQAFVEGTALRPISYQFYYEFVSRHSGTDGSCNRNYILSKMKPKGSLRTTDNVFDYGRGGRSNLTCTYTFTLPPQDALKLTLKSASFGDRPCRTLTDYETARHSCNYHQQQDNSTGNNLIRSQVSLYEYIWGDLNNLTSHYSCLCSNFSQGPTFTFLGRKVELVFRVEGMNAKDSFENYFAHFEYEVLKGEGCKGDNHYIRTESGLISLESTFTQGPKSYTCDTYPYLLEARGNHSLYLRILGYPMIQEKRQQGAKAPPTPITYHHNHQTNNSETFWFENVSSTATPPNDPTQSLKLDRGCPTTKNRIFIYDGEGRLVQKICPHSMTSMNKKASSQIVEIYSEDFGKFHSPLFPPPNPRFLIHFVGREFGSYQIKWLELISAKMKTSLKLLDFDPYKTTQHRPTNITETEQEQLRRGGKPSWDEALTKLFEGHNGEGDFDSEGSGGLGLGSGICSSYCPELRGCIHEKLWCDGEIHCPITGLDENQCDNFWATLNQLLSPAVYVPVFAAAASALCCCGLVILCVAVKRMLINMRGKGQLQLGVASSSASSRTSTVDRRVPERDYFYEPQQPNS